MEIRIADLEREVHVIEKLEKVDDLGAVRGSLFRMKQRILPLAYRDAAQVLGGLCEPASKLARDIGKEPPDIRIEASDIFLSHGCADMLRHVFVHILRNALDHGIETASERTMKNKPAQGLIRISATPDAAGWLALAIRDDGRGLALQMIQQIAVNRGLLPPDTIVTPQKIAQYIFESGFSTSSGVNEISGRGMGMDAVRRLLLQSGAQVEIILETKNQDLQPFVPFVFHIRIPPHLYRLLPALKTGMPEAS
ncbi:ATP-binding protein [Oligoflexus tunisiensis]|uniref:ATP-binding protein n=1 Tax=Oligoflexus tunisiensis TaxID=708132 RepID=UPI000B220274|nr:ATP-binding protein [Oligoflexus tunisiensis]